jgi:hypothetical protein
MSQENTADMQTESGINNVPEAPAEKQVTMQDVEKKHFGAEQLEAGSNYINEVMAICERENVEPIFNFDPSGDLPEGYGLAVIPLQKRIPERGNLTFGIVVAAIPSVDVLMAEESGINYINKLITDALIRQVTVSAKPKDEGAEIAIPFKVSEFVTTSRSSGLAAFNAVATDYVKALKTKGLKFMSKVLLRQVLASAQFAEQQFPRLSQENWQLVLQSMIAHVKQKGMESGVLQHWINTRDTVEIDVTEIDLSDLDDML